MKKIFLLFGIISLTLLSCGSHDGPVVEPAQKPLAVEMSSNISNPVLFEAVSFAAKVSGGSGNMAVSWSFGDGFTGTGIVAQHGFRTAGTYVAEATVTSGAETVKASKTITVADMSLSRALKSFDRSRVWLMAHRCNTGNTAIPENSIAALNNCIALRNSTGYPDLVEIDPRYTKDGVMVIMHDETVNRTTNGTGKVSELTWAQVQNLRLKANGMITDERVPTIQEFLTAAKGKMWVNLDFSNKVSHTGMYNEVKNCGMLDECLFPIGNDTEMASSLLLCSPQPILRTSVSSESQVTAHKGMGLYVTTVTAARVLAFAPVILSAVSNGFAVMSQTLVQDGITIDYDMRYNNDYSGVDLFVNQGINIIQTDYAPWMDTYLKSINKR